ncbi:M20/M25/M40 family metallo-hydrolase [Virgibacillus sp. C22-A2]|uniref:M20/M25/M40 family metallo-hydrolase n=1 Tax=Virgibacillus tibetensis TaxID=3042313 RepID=A0ABU6KDX1_9BACI|nr:M20/M25/M40 family metallo-hydrolase [Virgibacillus sp. C22-A2]
MVKSEEFIENLTAELIGVPSINGTQGEIDIIYYLENKLRELPYFLQHTDDVWTQDVSDDPLNRKNLFALVKGTKTASTKTVILHAHCDTVTIEDFGGLKDLATKPYLLADKLKELNLSEEIKDDLYSGDWLFGRGSVDMKSGIAAHFWVIKYLSEQTDLFEGNVLLMINPIEETTHGGIIGAIPELVRLKETYNTNFVSAINTDFVGPLYKGDLSKYIYLGSVGKLLPSFLIRGKETHVGQPFEGLDPNFLGGELISRIELNPNLSDYNAGEYTPPPTVLKMKDLKPTYNVQTPIETFLYFNYFVHGKSPDKVLEQLRGIAQDVFDDTVKHFNELYQDYCEKTGIEFTPLPWNSRVMIYSELYEQAVESHGNEVDERLTAILNHYAEKEDPREVTRRMVQELLNLIDDKDPIIVVFFCTPYCPRNYVKGKNDNEKNVLAIIEGISKQKEDIKTRNYFPFLSDSSYLSIDDSDEEIEQLKVNFPGMEKLYPVPVEKIKGLDIPAITMGVWGKDAHKWTERVYKPYAFQELPKMIERVTLEMLGN